MKKQMEEQMGNKTDIGFMLDFVAVCTVGCQACFPIAVLVKKIL